MKKKEVLQNAQVIRLAPGVETPMCFRNGTHRLIDAAFLLDQEGGSKYESRFPLVPLLLLNGEHLCVSKAAYAYVKNTSHLSFTRILSK